MQTCHQCGNVSPEGTRQCPRCGAQMVTPPPYNNNVPPYPRQPQYVEPKSKVAAGLFAILLGWLGVQYFYCGKVTGGILAIVLSIVTCGLFDILFFVQGIIMLTMSDRDFMQKYVYTQSSFPLF